MSSADRPPPRATRAGRLADFTAAMFPPAQVPGAVAQFFAVYWSLLAMAGAPTMFVTWRAVIGAASIVLFSLLLRVYDELKDLEQDVRLGRAGDPRYADRPIVTGHVREGDLRFLRWTVTALLVGINLPLGPTPSLAAFAVAFALCWLSFHWFFWPAVKNNLLLAFVTHNPLALVLGGYIVVLFAGDYGWKPVDGYAWLVVVGAWAPMAAWETSRKIRIPEDETDYQTYSKILGWKVAAIVPVAFLALATACTLIVIRRIGLAWPFQLGLLGAAAIGIGACLRFRLAPTSARAKLQPFMELFIVVVYVGLAIALPATYGVDWLAGAPWSD